MYFHKIKTFTKKFKFRRSFLIYCAVTVCVYVYPPVSGCPAAAFGLGYNIFAKHFSSVNWSALFCVNLQKFSMKMRKMWNAKCELIAILQELLAGKRASCNVQRAVLIASNYSIHFKRKCTSAYNPHTVHTHTQHPHTPQWVKAASIWFRWAFLWPFWGCSWLHHRANYIFFYGYFFNPLPFLHYSSGCFFFLSLCSSRLQSAVK